MSNHTMRPDWPLELVVAEQQMLTADTCRLVLRAADAGPLPPFQAGAHLRFHLPLPDAREGTERAYSLVNGASANPPPFYEIAVKADPAGKGGSRYMHALSVGDRLQACLPKEDFSLHPQPHCAILIAGGIGITPILSMARRLAADGRSFHLHYATREPDGMAYRDETEAFGAGAATLYFDQGDPARGMPLGEVLGSPAPDRHAYVCGPRKLIDATIAAARALRWPDANVHFELFGTAPQAGDRAARVVLQRSGIALDVPASKSILDAMLDAGLDPIFDCKRGECGVCALRVVHGDVDHRDYALSDSQRGQEGLMCVCVSGARGAELVLDA